MLNKNKRFLESPQALRKNSHKKRSNVHFIYSFLFRFHSKLQKFNKCMSVILEQKTFYLYNNLISQLPHATLTKYLIFTFLSYLLIECSMHKCD